LPRRSRLLRRLAPGTGVVEAALRSGSPITACYALDRGRDDFADPGPSRSPPSAGRRHLLRDGARRATTPADILGLIGLPIENISF
jgi:DNA processing protein